MGAGEGGRIVVAGRPWLRYDPAQLCPCSSTSCCPQMISVGPSQNFKKYSFSQSRSQEDEKYHDILGKPEFHAIEPICAVREGFSFLLSNARSLAIISVV